MKARTLGVLSVVAVLAGLAWWPFGGEEIPERVAVEPRVAEPAAQTEDVLADPAPSRTEAAPAHSA